MDLHPTDTIHMGLGHGRLDWSVPRGAHRAAILEWAKRLDRKIDAPHRVQQNRRPRHGPILHHRQPERSGRCHRRSPRPRPGPPRQRTRRQRSPPGINARKTYPRTAPADRPAKTTRPKKTGYGKKTRQKEIERFSEKMPCFCAAGSFVARKDHEADLAIVRCGSDAAMDEASPQKYGRFFEKRSSPRPKQAAITHPFFSKNTVSVCILFPRGYPACQPFLLTSQRI
jgi:hypothetical protein